MNPMISSTPPPADVPPGVRFGLVHLDTGVRMDSLQLQTYIPRTGVVRIVFFLILQRPSFFAGLV